MSHVTKLRAALAAVPVAQPCTPAAVKALHGSGIAVAQYLTEAGRTVEAPQQVLDACVEQQLPGACMPVLAWLAAGLRSGLPPAATQQAHAMACALLGVVMRVLPDKGQLASTTEPSPMPLETRARLLEQLGTTEEMCRQLAQVVEALLATAFAVDLHSTPSSSTSSESSSRQAGSNTAPSLLQQVSMAQVWSQLCTLLRAVRDAIGKSPLGAALVGSGLYQVLPEGTLLLLGVDPAAYLQTSEAQLELWDSLKCAMNASHALLGSFVGWMAGRWLEAPMEEMGQDGADALDPDTISNVQSQPWVQPLCKLYILLIAKELWDVRQCPSYVTSSHKADPWPAKALTRALTQMRSPCVAGDMLRQRAPGLVQHTRSCRRLRPTPSGGQHWEVTEEGLSPVPARRLGMYLQNLTWIRHEVNEKELLALDPLELSLVMEASELCCLVCPTSAAPTVGCAYTLLKRELQLSTGGLATFAVTCGEALTSIAEYLVEDVLLVMGEEGDTAAGACNTHRNENSSSCDRSSRTGTGDAAAPTTCTAPSGAPPSASSSGSTKRPTAGGRNPGVTLERRLTWARDVLCCLGTLLSGLQRAAAVIGMQGLAGDHGQAVQKLLTSSNGFRLCRLGELAFRTPALLVCVQMEDMHMLPRVLPALHAAASCPGGGRVLLSAVSTTAKWQRAATAVLSAVVEAGGVLAPAAAAVVAAVPGHTGKASAQLFLQEPAMFVYAAYGVGMDMACLAQKLFAQAAALLDPALAPAAAYLGVSLLPGQSSRLWGLEALLTLSAEGPGEEARFFSYLPRLFESPQQLEGVVQGLRVAVAEQHAAHEFTRAGKLAAQSGAAEAAEQLRERLSLMWLGCGEATPSTSGSSHPQPVEVRCSVSTQCPAVAAAKCSQSSLAEPPPLGELPALLQDLCREGLLQLEQLLPLGAPFAQAAHQDRSSQKDLRVAATMLVMACKAAGAVAQLPQLLEQVKGIMEQQPWEHARGVDARTVAATMRLHGLQKQCELVAVWVLLLAPALGALMTPGQRAQLQEMAASLSPDSQGALVGTPQVTGRVLGLLGQVVASGATGCSYPGCCNLEGRSEAELPVQVCRGVRYCCKEHQVAHWKAGHKEACRAVQAAVQQILDVGAGGYEQPQGNGQVPA